jgi:hypoxanthine phosphoribosyltransferase
LLDKESRRQISTPIKYIGFKIENEFVVGYGLDFDERFRDLPDVAVLEMDTESVGGKSRTP